MISFRTKHPESLEWDSASFSGENEEMLSHLFAVFLDNAGWEFLSARDEEDFGDLLWEDEDE